MLGLRLAAGAVVFVVGYTIAMVLLVPVFGPGLGTILSVIVGGVAGHWIMTRPRFAELPIISAIQAQAARNETRNAARIAIRNAQPIKLFGQETDRPAFLGDVQGFYDRRNLTPAWYRAQNGQIVAAGIMGLSRTDQNECRLFESMFESARFEMLRRGLDVQDKLNRPIGPTIYPDGLLIESTENEDGSVSHILAIDVGDTLDQDDWALANKHKIGRNPGAWNEHQHANRVVGRGHYGNPGNGIMPLYYLKLREFVEATETATDPLARKDGGVSYDFPEEWR